MSTTTADTGETTTAWRRWALWIVLVAATCVGAAILISTLVRVIIATVQGLPPVTLIGLQQIVPSSGTTSSFTSISMVFGHVSMLVVWLASSAVIIQALTQTAVAVLVAQLAWRLLHERPFRRSLYAYTTAGGLSLIVGGVLSQLLFLAANGVAVLQAENEGTPPSAWPLAGRFDLSFIGMGVLLLLIGAAFKVGTALQRDTEGLV